MNNIIKFLLIGLCFTFWGCTTEDEKSLIVGEWHLYKYFIDNTDVTNSCHNSCFFIINDDNTININVGKSCDNSSFKLPSKLSYYFNSDNKLEISDDSIDDIYYKPLEIVLLTRTELEIVREDSGFKLRYILNKVR